ncbi:MAG: hypothetical protein K8R88_10285 [Armatimonadetes bacterium]|nr:hypothetical protein [Armatimonadota bacterium]
MNEYRVYKAKGSLEHFFHVFLPNRVGITISEQNSVTGVVRLELPPDMNQRNVYLSVNSVSLGEFTLTTVYGSSEVNGPLIASFAPGAVYLAGFGPLTVSAQGVRPQYVDSSGQTVIELIPVWRDSDIAEGLLLQASFIDAVSPVGAIVLAVGMSWRLFEPGNFMLATGIL